MKPILYILTFTLLSAIFAPSLNAQSIEQISYMPVKRGNYSHLMIKKKAYFGGDLTVQNDLRSYSTNLHLTASNKLTFANTTNINAYNNIYLYGTAAQITGSATVGSSSLLSVKANSVSIGTFTPSGIIAYDTSINATSLNYNGGGNFNIDALFVDGVEFPNNCTYRWIDNVKTTDGGTFKVLACQ